MSDRIQIRRDTAANWTSVNPILADGEIGFEKDTRKFKVGDGTTAWSSLSNASDTLSASEVLTLLKTVDGSGSGLDADLLDGHDTSYFEVANANIQTHVTDVTTNPHNVTKTQVGLGNADNTSDANKPVSTAQQTALDLKDNKKAVVVTSVSATMLNAANTHYVYLVAGLHTMTLPTAVGNLCYYTIKNNHSAAITVDTTSAQTIDGTTTIQISPEDSVDLVSNNANWSIV